jgi:hypothetical protein
LALLAYLIMEPGEYRREQLTRLVWSSVSSGSIDTALSELRAAFGLEVIPPRARTIALDPALVEMDALRVLAATTDPESRADAIVLYRGPFLESFNARGSADGFIRWVERTRGRVEEAFRQLCEAECEWAAGHGDWRRVLEVAKTGLRKSPGWSGGERWRETAAHAMRPVPPTPEVAEEQVAGIPAAAEPAASPRSVPGGQPSHTFGLTWAGIATALLVVLGVLVIRGKQPSHLPVRMPPIRAGQLPAPGSPIRTLSDWVRTDGQWIYYRYERYMPAACQHETQAVGNFGRNGWTKGIPVVCLNGTWLAVDGERLIRKFSLAPETTYCLQFLYIEDQTSFYSQHGPENAPGLDSIRVVAPGGEYNIGFAVLRTAPGEWHIELTHRYPSSRC